MRRLDPFVVIAKLRPPRARSALLQPGEDAVADALLTRITTALDTQAARRPARRRRWAIGATVAIGAIGGTTIAVARWAAAPDHPTIVSCWAAASPDAAQYEARLDDGQTPPDACRMPWTDGPLGHDGPPPLASCVSPTGIIAVVPGDASVCAVLGLAELDASTQPSPAASQGAELQTRIGDPLAAGCFDEADTRALVQDVLADEQFAGWTTQTGEPFTPERPCALVIIDDSTRALIVSTRPQ